MAAALERLEHSPPPDPKQCEASPVDITFSGVNLYCLGDEYMIWANRTLTIIKEEIWVHIEPPPLVGSCCVLPILEDSMEGVLSDLESPPQCFFKQKQRGKLPHESLDNVPNPTMEYVPFC